MNLKLFVLIITLFFTSCDGFLSVIEKLFSNIVTTVNHESFNCLDFYISLKVHFKRNSFVDGKNKFQTQFYLTQNETDRVELKLDEQNQFVEFDVTRPTVLIVHGFFANSYARWVKQLATAFQKKVRFILLNNL